MKAPTDQPAAVLVEIDRLDAICRLLVDSGDMTPMARMLLKRVVESDAE